MALRNKSQLWPLPTSVLSPAPSFPRRSGSGTRWPSDCSSLCFHSFMFAGVLASYVRWLNLLLEGSLPGSGSSLLGLPIPVADHPGCPGRMRTWQILSCFCRSQVAGAMPGLLCPLWPLVTLSVCAVDSLPFNKRKPSNTSVWSPSSNGQPARSYI